MSGIALRIDDNLSVLHSFGDVKYIQNKQPKINNAEKFPSELNIDNVINSINDTYSADFKNRPKYTKENLIVACKIDKFDNIAFIPFGYKQKLTGSNSGAPSSSNLNIKYKYKFNPVYYKKFIPSLKDKENLFKEIRDNDPIVSLFEVTINSTNNYLLLFKENSELKSTGTQHEINSLENYNNFPFLVHKDAVWSIWTKKNNIAGVYRIDSIDFKKYVKDRIEKVYDENYKENFEIDIKNKLIDLIKIKFNYGNFADIKTLEKMVISYPEIKSDIYQRDIYQDDIYQNNIDFNEFNFVPEMILILHEIGGSVVDFADLLQVIENIGSNMGEVGQ